MSERVCKWVREWMREREKILLFRKKIMHLNEFYTSVFQLIELICHCCWWYLICFYGWTQYTRTCVFVWFLQKYSHMIFCMENNLRFGNSSLCDLFISFRLMRFAHEHKNNKNNNNDDDEDGNSEILCHALIWPIFSFK
jgi:hypothetical protein